jgi:hypothetical protein
LAENAKLANVFANRADYGGRNVLPVVHRMSKGAGVHLPDGVSNREVYGTVAEAFDDGPFDALRFSNYNIPEIKNQRVYMVKNPNQVRSRFAAFDPFKKNSANLLARLLQPPDYLSISLLQKRLNAIDGTIAVKLTDESQRPGVPVFT